MIPEGYTGEWVRFKSTGKLARLRGMDMMCRWYVEFRSYADGGWTKGQIDLDQFRRLSPLEQLALCADEGFDERP